MRSMAESAESASFTLTVNSAISVPSMSLLFLSTKWWRKRRSPSLKSFRAFEVATRANADNMVSSESQRRMVRSSCLISRTPCLSSSLNSTTCKFNKVVTFLYLLHRWIEKEFIFMGTCWLANKIIVLFTYNLITSQINP